jgi:thiamine pyrophosphokinase
MKLAVLANGDWDSAWGIKALADIDVLICADGGGNHALRSGRIPDYLIGDMDSIFPMNLKICEQSDCIIQRYPSQKDETDLELALLRAEEQVRSANEQDIWLYGVSGKRIDHVLGNLALMLAYAQRGLRLCAVDPKQEMWIIRRYEEIQASAGQVLSLIPLSEKAVVSTEGLFYPLKKGVIFQNSPRGISNVFTGERAVVEVHEGWVLAVLLKVGEA